MFNERVSEMGMLTHDLRGNILKFFPLSVVKSVVNLISDFLDSGVNFNEVLPTDAHVQWVIDCLGYGFTMPIENEKVGHTCISLYTKWLNPATRPSSMNEKLNFFLSVSKAHTHTHTQNIFSLPHNTQIYPRLIVNKNIYIYFWSFLKKTMAKQVSLIFEPRGKTKAEIEIHADLCRQGLAFYSAYSRMELTQEDREDLLKLVLGATDCVLNPAPGTDLVLCKVLGGEMLHTLYDIWLYSETKSSQLWDIFRVSYGRWAYLVEAVNQWSAVMKGLLEHIVDELYHTSTTTTTKPLTIVCGRHTATLDLSPEYIHYAWNRVVPLLGDANAIRESEPHKLAMSGLAACVEILLRVVEEGAPGAPDANTVLDLFGHDLFEAAYTLQPRHEAGTATAITTLCRVFATCRAAGADKRYLAAYYNAVRSCLTTPEGSPILINTLQNTEGLFTQGLPGARLLVPHYVRMLERIAASPLLADRNRAGSGEALISSCIAVLSVLLSVGTRFQNTRFVPTHTTADSSNNSIDAANSTAPAFAVSASQAADIVAATAVPTQPMAGNGNGNALPEIETYDDLEAHMGGILLRLLCNETLLPTTTEAVLWQSYVFLREYLPSATDYGLINTSSPQVGLQVAPRFAWSFLNHVLRQVAEGSSGDSTVGSTSTTTASNCGDGSGGSDNAWPASVVRTALNVLAAAAGPAGLYAHLPRAEAYAARVVERLAHYITDRVVNGAHGDSAAGLVATAFDVATRWAMTGAWMGSARPVFVHLIETCLICTPGCSRAHVPEQPAEVADAALQCFLTVINRWGVFPSGSGSGAARLSPLLDEEALVRRTMAHYGLGLPDAAACVRHYALDDAALITFVDVPELSERDGLAAVVILRDRTGKYVWRAQFQALAPEEPCAEVIAAVTTEQCTVPHRSSALHAHSEATNASEATQMWSQELYASLDAIGIENITADVRALIAAQTRFGAESHYFLAEDAALSPPVHEPVAALVAREPARSVAGRALAAQLGYLTPYGRAALTPLEASAELYGALRALDGLPERETLRVGVLYQRAGMGEHEALGVPHAQTSPQFRAFAQALGWLVDTATHTGFLGGLDRKGSTGRSALYYADFATEFAFHVAPLMSLASGNASASDEERAKKRRVLGKDYVLIVWSDDGSYDAAAFPNMQQNVKIVISPLPRTDGLYKVVVHCSDRLREKPGPLRGTTVVSRRALAPLVRLTALSGSRAVADIVEAPARPFTARQRKIAEIVRAHRADVRPALFFASHFFYDPRAHASLAFPPRTVLARPHSRPLVAQQQQAPMLSSVTPPPPSLSTMSPLSPGKAQQQQQQPPPPPQITIGTTTTTTKSKSSTSPAPVRPQQQQHISPPPFPAPAAAAAAAATTTTAMPSQQQQVQQQQQQQQQQRPQLQTKIGPPIGPPPPVSSMHNVSQQQQQGSYGGQYARQGSGTSSNLDPRRKATLFSVNVGPPSTPPPPPAATATTTTVPHIAAHPPSSIAPPPPPQSLSVAVHQAYSPQQQQQQQQQQCVVGSSSNSNISPPPPSSSSSSATTTAAAGFASMQKRTFSGMRPPQGAAPSIPSQKTQNGYLGGPMIGNRAPPHCAAPPPPGMKTSITIKNSPILQKKQKLLIPPPSTGTPGTPQRSGAIPPPGAAPQPPSGPAPGAYRRQMPPSVPAPNPYQ